MQKPMQKPKKNCAKNFSAGTSPLQWHLFAYEVSARYLVSIIDTTHVEWQEVSQCQFKGWFNRQEYCVVQLNYNMGLFNKMIPYRLVMCVELKGVKLNYELSYL